MSLRTRFRSVRAVLTLWYSVVLVAAFLVFGVGVYAYLHHALHRALERELSTEVEWIAQRLAVGGQAQALATLSGLPPDVRRSIETHLEKSKDNYTVVVTTADDRVVYLNGDRTMREMIRRPSVQGRTVVASLERGPGDWIRMASLSRGSFAVHVGIPDEEVRQALREVLRILLVLAPVALILAVGGGWVLAGVVLRPIGQITESARRMTAENLQERIPERAVDDELGRLVKTLNRAADRLEAAFDQMKQFTSNVAHELKTPLTILRGEAELALQKSLSPEEARELAATFLEETTRIANVVDDLLTLARADAGQADLARVPVPLAPLVDEICEEARLLGSEKGLAVELLENSPATVPGDPARLRRLLRALTSNAVRYTDPGGTIRIGSRREDGRVRVAVEDTGIGIPRQSLSRIFDRFYRVDEARSRERGGSGLGLSLARWIAESHGGSIEVRSEPGRGSRFVVTLPASPDPA